MQGVNSDPAFYVLVRFLLGFLVIASILILKKRPPRPVKYHLLAGRAVANSIAVYCFYMAVQTTSVAHANILNMTYPVFVALITWGFLFSARKRGRRQPDWAGGSRLMWHSGVGMPSWRFRPRA